MSDFLTTYSSLLGITLLILVVVIKSLRKIENKKVRIFIQLFAIITVPILIFFFDSVLEKYISNDGWKEISFRIAELAVQHSGWFTALLSYSLIVVYLKRGPADKKIQKIAWVLFLVVNLISIRYYFLITFFPLLLIYPVTLIWLIYSKHGALANNKIKNAFLVLHSILLVIGIYSIISEGGTWGNIGQIIGAFMIPLSTILITFLLIYSNNFNFIGILKILTGIISLTMMMIYVNNFSNEIYEDSSVIRFRYLSQLFCILLIVEGCAIKFKEKISLTLKMAKAGLIN